MGCDGVSACSCWRPGENVTIPIEEQIGAWAMGCSRGGVKLLLRARGVRPVAVEA